MNQKLVKGPALITKITLKEMGLDKETLVELVMRKKDSSLEIPVARIYGHASSATIELSPLATEGRNKEKKQNSYVKFTGNFKGVNQLTGKSFRSGKLIMAGPAESVLHGMVEAVQGEGASFVTFAVDITVKYNKDAATMYTFGAVPVIEQENDPLAALEKLLPA